MAMKLHGQSGFSFAVDSCVGELSPVEKGVVGMSASRRVLKLWIVMPLSDRVNVHDQFRWPGNLHSMIVCDHLGLRRYEDNRLAEILRCPTEIQVDIRPFADGKCNVRGFLRSSLLDGNYLEMGPLHLTNAGHTGCVSGMIRGSDMKAGR